MLGLMDKKMTLVLAGIAALIVVASVSLVVFFVLSRGSFLTESRKTSSDLLPQIAATPPGISAPSRYAAGARTLSRFAGDNLSGFVHSAAVEVNIRGKIAAIGKGTLTLSTGAKKMEATDGEGFTKTSAYDMTASGGRLPRMSPGDLRVGDAVLVTLVVDAATGKERVRAIYRIVEGGSVDRLLLY